MAATAATATATTSKVGVVTGGASGIGRACVRKLAALGCTVVFGDIDATAGAALLAELTAAGKTAVFVETNVKRDAEIARLVETCVTRFGRLDYAVNCAGLEGERAPTHEATEENFRHVMETNCNGVFLSMKHELIQMVKQRSGGIVNISSTAGIRAFPGWNAYCASKWAIMGMTKTAAIEYASMGIRVNCVCPATTDTAMVTRFATRWPEYQAAANASYPLGRIATAEEVAEACWFLLDSACGFITGENIVIDGGLSSR
ncbi:SDR family oxidoreductase [Pelomyxa schiedti]|nr:SDR family oxidoreductase [Pelomyxa schiedti]